MLLWELVATPARNDESTPQGEPRPTRRYRRLPFDTRCSAVTKSGRRCRGKIRSGTEFCPFHDPALTPERRRRIAAKGGRSRNPLAHLPDGYLRKLTTRAAVGQCMDRLYREVRLGVITPEMGAVMFSILCRLLDAGLVDTPNGARGKTGRSKAERIRPKLAELLTRQEQAAWKQAVKNAPAYFSEAERQPDHPANLQDRPSPELDPSPQDTAPLPTSS